MGAAQVVMTAGLSLVLVSGCGAGSQPGDGALVGDDGASAPAAGVVADRAAVAVGATAPAADESGCQLAQVRIESDDLTLVSLGQSIYARLDCRAETPMKAQLAYVRGVPEVAAAVANAGGTVAVEAAGDGVGMRVYTDAGTCVVTVSDAPRTKLLTCG